MFRVLDDGIQNCIGEEVPMSIHIICVDSKKKKKNNSPSQKKKKKKKRKEKRKMKC